MLHSLGKKPERDARDVVTRLVDCHARIREMNALAARLAFEEGASDAERSETATRVSRYFTRALPLHVRDEEDSIAPRLAALSADVAAALDRMRADHEAHEAEVSALVAACDAIAKSPYAQRARRSDVAIRQYACVATNPPGESRPGQGLPLACWQSTTG